MIDCVSDQVHEWIGQLLDDQLVDLGIRSGHHESHLFIFFARGLSDDASKLVENLTQWDHSNVEDSRTKLHQLAFEAATNAVQAHRRLPV